MADKQEARAPTRRAKPNSVAVDEKTPAKAAVPRREADAAAGDVPSIAPHDAKPEKTPKTPSVEAGDMPEAVRKRYYADKAKWSGEPAFFTSAESKYPAFRDQGRRLVTATESQEVVKDLVAIAQHRGWDKIHVTGSEAFRRAVWLEAAQNGLEVRGYKPNERDLQELDRHRQDGSRNTIAPMIARDASNDRDTMSGERSGSRPERRHIAGHADGRSPANSRAVDSQLRVIEAVIQRTLFDNPEAVARVMTVARAQFDAHVAAGRDIRPAVVRDPGLGLQRSSEPGGGSSRSAAVRQGRDHRPPERNRSR